MDENVSSKIAQLQFRDQSTFEKEFDMNEKQEIRKCEKCTLYKLTSKINKKVYQIRYAELSGDKKLTNEEEDNIKKAMLVRNTNVVKYFDIYKWETGGKFVYVIKQDFTNYRLEDLIQERIQKKKKISDIQMLWLTDQMLQAIESVNRVGISVSPVCPLNIQSGTDDVWKIANWDKGFEDAYDGGNFDLDKLGDCKYFLAPEYIKAMKTGDKSLIKDPVKTDVYGLGICLIRISALYDNDMIQELNSEPEETHDERITKLSKTKEVSASGSRQMFVDIMQNTTKYDSEKRMTLAAIRSKITAASLRQDIMK